MTNPLQVVLDTNVVLDWLVFADAGVRDVALAIQQGHLRCLCCAEMRAELAHVLVHGGLELNATECERVLTYLDSVCDLVVLPVGLPLPRLRCSDTSDQMFIDLALSHHARWLLTRDRALLKLARRALPQGLQILRPADWKPQSSAPTAA